MNYKYCPNCGARVKLSAKFCVKCGYHFTNNDVASPNLPSRSLRQSRSNNSNNNSSGCGFLICSCLIFGALGMILEGFGLSSEIWDIVGLCLGVPVYQIYRKLYHK